jgi:transposase
VPRRKTKNSKDNLLARQREREALTYRLGGMKLWEIAQKLGVTEAGVSKMLSRTLDATSKEISEKAEELRAVQLERTEMMIRGLWSKAMVGDEKAVDTIRKLLERQARLLGIDAPERKEITGKDGEPLTTEIIYVNPGDATT